MKRAVLGTAGHIDHGKTLLTKALTGVDTDRLAEEKARIQRRIDEKRAEIAAIKAKQRRFNTDREFVETLARQNRRVYPGELVFVFED